MNVYNVGTCKQKLLSKREYDDLRMYFQYAKLAGERSKSERLKVGACIVTKHGGNYVGYNGTLSGRSNCCETDDNVTHNGVIHAEANALDKMQKDGISSLDATVYITHSPCEVCLTRMINAGVKTVYYNIEYRVVNHLRDEQNNKDIEIIHVPEDSLKY